MPLTDKNMEDLGDLVRRVVQHKAINEQLNLIVPQIQSLRDDLRTLKVTEAEIARYAEIQRLVTA